MSTAFKLLTKSAYTNEEKEKPAFSSADSGECKDIKKDKKRGGRKSTLDKQCIPKTQKTDLDTNKSTTSSDENLSTENDNESNESASPIDKINTTNDEEPIRDDAETTTPAVRQEPPERLPKVKNYFCPFCRIRFETFKDQTEHNETEEHKTIQAEKRKEKEERKKRNQRFVDEQAKRRQRMRLHKQKIASANGKQRTDKKIKHKLN